MTTTNHEKTLFILAILITTASKGDVITYDELRRLARLSDRQLGSYLGQARQLLQPGEPDPCAVVVKALGTPGWGWGDLAKWQAEVQRVWDYWRDRRALDNLPFDHKYGALPSVPGTLAP